MTDRMDMLKKVEDNDDLPWQITLPVRWAIEEIERLRKSHNEIGILAKQVASHEENGDWAWSEVIRHCRRHRS